jgi:hypothetical protein
MRAMADPAAYAGKGKSTNGASHTDAPRRFTSPRAISPTRGVLMGFREGDPIVESWLNAFRLGLTELGWKDRE